MTTALTVYQANAASGTSGLSSTANQLYAGSSGSPATSQPTTTLGTATGYGEILARGGSTWAAAGSLPAPSGNGFVLDASQLSLNGQQIVAGSWSAEVRFGAMQSGSLAGTLSADIYVRAYKYNGGTYTNIVTMKLASQTINSTLTTYLVDVAHSATGTSGSAITFGASDFLYMDIILNITANTNANVNQGVRNNRLSTDTSTFVGDINASLTTPGYIAGITNVTETIIETATGTELVSTKWAAGITETGAGNELVTAGNPFVVTEQAVTNSELVIMLQGAINIATLTEQAAGAETVVMVQGIQSPGNVQMQQGDLVTQYSRLYANVIAPQLKLVATTYYGNANNNQIVYGELDAVLNYETIAQMHVMKTINDVNAFLLGYEYIANVLNDAPVAYWRLTESSGAVAYDYSGRSYNGTISGGVTLGASGALASSADTAMTFNGSSGAILLSSGLQTANWAALTVECWLNFPSLTYAQTGTIIGNSHTGVDQLGFRFTATPNAGAIRLNVGNGGSNVGPSSSFTFVANTWYHVAGVYDGAHIQMYVNGATSGAPGTFSGAVATSASAAGIGYNPLTGGDYIPATLQSVAIYNYALSSTRLLAHYNAGINP